MTQPLPCIVCDYQPESAVGDLERNQPHKATAFTTTGHYGSTVWDPGVYYSTTDTPFLEVNVCDECLVAKKDRVLRGRPVPRNDEPTTQYTAWDPEAL